MKSIKEMTQGELAAFIQSHLRKNARAFPASQLQRYIFESFKTKREFSMISQ
jgi:hypothetical protein